MALIYILWDQLSPTLSSLKDVTKNDTIVMSELKSDATIVKHHKKKLVFLYSAMRNFAKALEDQGLHVVYTKLTDPDNTHTIAGELKRQLEQYPHDNVIFTEASEYHNQQTLLSLCKEIDQHIEIREDDRFLCNHEKFGNWAKNRKQLRMEYFYRDMRKQYDILMTGDQPVGGQWNFDKDNRSPPKKTLNIPSPYKIDTDVVTLECMQMVSDCFPDHFGDILPFFFATTREGALAVLDHFINNRLANFGTYQDAMLENEPWMYHSHISFYLNCGLLLPLECIEAAEEALHQDKAPLNAVEGFIRQILGWREFIRGIYWLKMPGYETENFLKASKPLPNFFWSSDTPMNCIKQVILETKENAYAHHIQRLMVIGNFALLAGLEPKAVNEWFWIVYADAYQWVELPNVSGMALFADGGVLGSKPYAASGAYINKMSNYCQNCQYNIKEKTGEQACPFNYLYWDFLERNRQILSNNPRLGFMYRLLDNMSDDNKQLFTQSAAHFLNAQY